MLKLIFPFFHSFKANKKVREKIQKIEQGNIEDDLEYMKGFEQLTNNEVQQFYDKTLDVKKSLEDKLKTSLFSVTIGITVLTSAISFLYSDGISSLNSIFKGIIFVTGSIAIIYMIIAGIFAVKTISGFISVYQLFPEDIANKTEDEQKEAIAICTELNSKANIIRQNLMSVSYHCIINSLIVITIFFFLIGFASFAEKPNSSKSQKIEITLHETLVSGANVQYLFSKQLEPIFIYFEKGSILPKLDHSLDKFENILVQQINKQNKYLIKITGFSSTEVVQYKNTLSDNYQISMARANNIKKSILDIADKYHFERENIVIEIFAYSNQNISKTETIDHQRNRKVKVEIIELVQKMTHPRS